MKISQIKTEKPFNSIFKINEEVLSAVKEHMEQKGYDPAAPIVVWQDTVVDGHTRLEAAKQAGFEEVPVEVKSFDSEEQALQYAIHNQRDRRNMTNAELLRCIEALDKRKAQGERTDRKQPVSEPKQVGRTHRKTAEVIGKGGATVSNGRAILDSEKKEIREKVESGQWSIDRGAKEARQEKKIKKEASPKVTPTFNETNENIDWAKWSWNPVTGCNHGCPYCYARDIANRFYPQGFEPTFHEERLVAPQATKIPKSKQNTPGIKNVFVCSMGDLLGDWVPNDWIEKVLTAIRENPQWNYLFLTKNPKRYLEFEFPENCWLGATADTQERMENALDVFSRLSHSVKFVSCEPLMEEVSLPENPSIHWLIIGGRSKSSGAPAAQPKWKWVAKLSYQAEEFNVKLYFKPNLEVPKEYPQPEWDQSEVERRKLVEKEGKTVVANMNKDKNLIQWAKENGIYMRIDRRTEWGNPYEKDKDGDRETVCDLHKSDLESDDYLYSRIKKELKRKVLGCHCFPKRCHGDNLAKVANSEE